MDTQLLRAHIPIFCAETPFPLLKVDVEYLTIELMSYTIIEQEF